MKMPQQESDDEFTQKIPSLLIFQAFHLFNHMLTKTCVASSTN